MTVRVRILTAAACLTMCVVAMSPGLATGSTPRAAAPSVDSSTPELVVSDPQTDFGEPALSYTGRRDPEGVEQLSLYPGHVVIRCDTPSGTIELALGPSSLMGFQSWLEASPPGAQHL